MSDDKKDELTRLRDHCHKLEQEVAAQNLELLSLRAGITRYESALLGTKVIVYTQDRDLRVTSISHKMLGRSIGDIIGSTDTDFYPPDISAKLEGLKRETLKSGIAQRTELPFEEDGITRWYDLHIEPLNNQTGQIVGLTCAMIDVSEHKEGEEHLRFLLRELTHRSKNLLAVVQAMARQTARHAGSTERFLQAFGARLQALSASHDLLVRENWHGASLRQLIQSQMRDYFEEGAGQGETRITIDGQDVALKPEAAQNLGLAIHEMAANAEQYGSLSQPEGQVAIVWKQLENGSGSDLEIEWLESGGPKVKPRRKKGFGSMVIEGNLARALDANVTLKFDPDGVQYKIVIPADQILTTGP